MGAPWVERATTRVAPTGSANGAVGARLVLARLRAPHRSGAPDGRPVGRKGDRKGRPDGISERCRRGEARPRPSSRAAPLGGPRMGAPWVERATTRVAPTGSANGVVRARLVLARLRAPHRSGSPDGRPVGRKGDRKGRPYGIGEPCRRGEARPRPSSRAAPLGLPGWAPRGSKGRPQGSPLRDQRTAS